MSLSREQMLIEMGISPIWVLREPGASSAPTVAPDAQAYPEAAPAAPVERREEPAAVAGPLAAVDSLNWPELAKVVATCTRCPLCEQRKQAVLGVGDLAPDWLFIGEGPGAEEDVQGEPFVGQAGKLLDNMLAALDISRTNKVYIANAVKCRPPGNRTPEAAEMAACRPYLERQIALLKPKIIVLLGKAAVHTILHDDKSLASLRGKRFEYAGIPVVVTYHPAYLLRNLPDKAKAWEDLLFARRLLRAQATPELPF
jgi:uracil-DNA glycosylase family 4